jgi:hypothetical protein
VRLDAFAALRRGWNNLRANWQLLPLQWLFGIAFGIAIVVSLLPLVFAVGWSVFADAPTRPEEWSEWLGALPEQVRSRLVPILLGALASMALGTAAILLWAFPAAGTYGVLWQGEGAPRDGAWAAFRRFRWADFAEWGRRRMWTYFWLFHLFVTLALLLVAFWALLVIGAAAAFQSHGGFAAFGVGCGGALPLLFLGLVASLWFQTSLVEAARPGVGALAASNAGLKLLTARPAAIFLFFVLQLVAGVALAFLFMPFSLMIDVAFRGQFGLGLAAKTPLQLVQWFLTTALQLIFQGAYVALARDLGGSWDPRAGQPIVDGGEPTRAAAAAGEGSEFAGVAAPLAAAVAFAQVADEPLPELTPDGLPEPERSDAPGTADDSSPAGSPENFEGGAGGGLGGGLDGLGSSGGSGGGE